MTALAIFVIWWWRFAAVPGWLVGLMVFDHALVFISAWHAWGDHVKHWF